MMVVWWRCGGGAVVKVGEADLVQGFGLQVLAFLFFCFWVFQIYGVKVKVGYLIFWIYQLGILIFWISERVERRFLGKG